MRKSRIDAAYRMAGEFRKAIEAMRGAEKERVAIIDTHVYENESPKHRGAVRRSSMDLTRALAEMRKPS